MTLNFLYGLEPHLFDVYTLKKHLGLYKTMKKFAAITTIGISVYGYCVPAVAQTLPDSGSILQQMPALELPKQPNKEILQELQDKTPVSKAETTAGPTVSLRSISFTGNTLYSSSQLIEILGDVSGKNYSFAGLRQLAERITDHYRRSGYPFARAFLPQQVITDGVLTIEILEGRYGNISVEGNADLVSAAQGFLKPLQPGNMIEQGTLERSMLLLDDMPGIAITPTLQPGKAVGTGDLLVQLSQAQVLSSNLGLDNQGNRYTGRTQAHFNLDANSPWLFGDQITLRSLVTNSGMWFGTLGYSLPLGTNGLRGQISHTKTTYQLGGEFRDLQAQGLAIVNTAGLNYPLVRSGQGDIYANLNWQQKQLTDEQRATFTSNDRRSEALVAGVRLSHRDAFLGGSITQAGLTWTKGTLHLQGAALSQDTASAQTNGAFHKINLDASRLQSLVPSISLFGRLAAQWSEKNLDSSEKFGLGGPNGVRAYPVGEGFGDHGWLTQLELRIDANGFAPFVFYDHGSTQINAKPWTNGNNHRSIAGFGAGVRYSSAKWRLEISAARRTQGGNPLSDPSGTPRAWMNASRIF